MSARFNGVKVFSATMALDRAKLGESVTEWMMRHPGISIVDVVQTQSSDESFHCVAITVFYNEPSPTSVQREARRAGLDRPARPARRAAP